MAGWNVHIVSYTLTALGLAAGWLVYTAVLWLLLKIQRLNYTRRGLFTSTAAAVAVQQIPWVGGYLSVPVLFFCVWKSTKADLVPDVVFTVVITGALMFCVNLWVLGSLLERVRPSLATATLEEPQVVAAKPPTNVPVVRATAAPVAPKRNYDNLGLNVRGIMLQSGKPAAMISWARGIIQLSPGETCSLETRDGYALIHCDSVSEKTVALTLGGQDKLTLTLR
jgi:hypothetical protein